MKSLVLFGNPLRHMVSLTYLLISTCLASLLACHVSQVDLSTRLVSLLCKPLTLVIMSSKHNNNRKVIVLVVVAVVAVASVMIIMTILS